MDKRLLKSLQTAKARYEKRIAEAKTIYETKTASDKKLLDEVNAMLASLGASDSLPQPASDIAQASSPEAGKEQLPAFLHKSKTA